MSKRKKPLQGLEGTLAGRLDASRRAKIDQKRGKQMGWFDNELKKGEDEKARQAVLDDWCNRQLKSGIQDKIETVINKMNNALRLSLVFKQSRKIYLREKSSIFSKRKSSVLHLDWTICRGDRLSIPWLTIAVENEMEGAGPGEYRTAFYRYTDEDSEGSFVDSTRFAFKIDDTNEDDILKWIEGLMTGEWRRK